MHKMTNGKRMPYPLLATLCGIAAINPLGCKSHFSAVAPTAPILPVITINGNKPVDITQIYTAKNFSDDLEAYKTAEKGSVSDESKLPEAKRLRNNIVLGEMGVIDAKYRIYHSRLFSDKNALAIGSDGVTLGLTAASSIATHVPTKTILSSLATAFTGLGISIDKNYFGQQSFQILGLAMQTRRDKVRTAILSNLSNCEVSTYALLRAQRDLVQYFNAGTLDSALEELQEEAGTATANASGGSAQVVTSANENQLPTSACQTTSAPPAPTPAPAAAPAPAPAPALAPTPAPAAAPAPSEHAAAPTVKKPKIEDDVKIPQPLTMPANTPH